MLRKESNLGVSQPEQSVTIDESARRRNARVNVYETNGTQSLSLNDLTAGQPPHSMTSEEESSSQLDLIPGNLGKVSGHNKAKSLAPADVSLSTASCTACFMAVI